MRLEVKAEDLQIGDQIYPRYVLDLFFRTNTLARTNKSGKGMVVVMFDDFSMKSFPIGHEISVYRKDEAPQVSG